MEVVACELCGSKETSFRHSVPDLLLNRPTVQARLVQCTHCGLIYQNPRPTLAEMGQHYPPDYEPYADVTSQTQQNWLLRKAIQYGNWKRWRFVTRHVQYGRLLDVGCATGTFLRAMQKQSKWDLHGVELNAEVAQVARERYGLAVVSGTLEEAAYPNAFFDVVTMWDVLEHLHHPGTTLREIHRILKPNGLLLVRVPNQASWDAQLFGDCWAGLDAPRHLYVFTPETLGRMLAQNQYQVVEHSSGIGSYVTFVLSVRFWMRAKQVRPQVEQAVSRILYHPLCRMISAPFFYLSSIVRRGPLLVTVARRTDAQRE